MGATDASAAAQNIKTAAASAAPGIASVSSRVGVSTAAANAAQGGKCSPAGRHTPPPSVTVDTAATEVLTRALRAGTSIMVLVNGELYPAVIAWGTAYVSCLASPGCVFGFQPQVGGMELGRGGAPMAPGAR